MRTHGCGFFLALVLLFGAPDLASARTIQWSGYTWTVRDTHGKHSNPGKNIWGSTPWNVRKMRSGALRMNISNGKATELIGPRLGYGRYRWVVGSDLTNKLDAHRVIGFFTHHVRRQSPAGEQDLEFARWGDPFRPIGWYVSWISSGRNAYGTFSVSPIAPYTLDLTWRHGRVEYSVKDGVGTVLLSQSLPTSFSGRNIAPSMSYWLWAGNKWDPRTRKVLKGPHPPITINSFRHTKLAKLAHAQNSLSQNFTHDASRHWRDDFSRVVQYSRAGGYIRRIAWPRFYPAS